MQTKDNLTATVLTLSDKGSRGERIDESGSLIIKILKERGFQITHYEIIPDERDILRDRLLRFSELCDLIITNGGTGLSPRDITPDVTKEILERELPGIPEAMRLAGLRKTPRAMLSRAVAGTRGRCLIVNLPGSPKAVEEGLEIIIDVLPHAIEKLKGSEEECARG